MPKSITVIIPAFNEAELLPRCLEALLPQARTFGTRVVVINNCSTDRTADIAKQAGVEVIDESRPGVVYAMQRGLHEATTDIIAFTDADTIVDPHWLEAIVEGFRDPAVIALTGPVRFEKMRFITWTRWVYRHMLMGSNMAIRRQAGIEVGGFDDRYNLASDIAFGWKLEKKGRIHYLPNMGVITSSRRFQARPVSQGTRFVLNHIWMLLFHHPLYWHFAPIRASKEVLDRQARRRTWFVGSILFLGILAYLSWWPTSGVFGQIQVHGRTKAKVIALTFDDGPNGQASRTIVDILVAKKVPATFFEVGRSVAADPTTAKYVADHGFSIGNHTWDHSFDVPFETPKNIHLELAHTSQVIHDATGQTPIYFRPPHGLRSPQLLFEVARDHMTVVDWSIDPQDYMTGSSQTIINRVIRHARPGRIVLLHDGLQDGFRLQQLRNRQGTIAALPVIIDRLRQAGYTFVSLNQLLPSESDTPSKLDIL